MKMVRRPRTGRREEEEGRKKGLPLLIIYPHWLPPTHAIYRPPQGLGDTLMNFLLCRSKPATSAAAAAAVAFITDTTNASDRNASEERGVDERRDGESIW